MIKKNFVFIGVSIDGYISDKNGGLEWLDRIPNPDKDDMGYYSFMDSIDALLMGRTTFETVCGFDIEWPYQKPVFVLSNTLNQIPEKLQNKVFLVNGSLNQVLNQIHKKGYYKLYIDGGKTIQSFLNEDLIDEMVISIIPTLLGGGSPLFAELEKPLNFELIQSKVYLNQIIQNHFKRIK